MEINTNEILDRVKYLLSIKTDLELSKYLEVHKATVSGWRQKNTLDWKLLLSKIESLDFNIIIKGQAYYYPSIHQNPFDSNGTTFSSFNKNDPFSLIDHTRSFLQKDFQRGFSYGNFGDDFITPRIIYGSDKQFVVEDLTDNGKETNKDDIIESDNTDNILKSNSISEKWEIEIKSLNDQIKLLKDIILDKENIRNK